MNINTLSNNNVNLVNEIMDGNVVWGSLPQTENKSTVDCTECISLQHNNSNNNNNNNMNYMINNMAMSSTVNVTSCCCCSLCQQQPMQLKNNNIYQRKCDLMNLCSEIIQKYVNIPSEFMNPSYDKCFCQRCHLQRNEYVVFPRGKPAKKYCVPLGWIRFGLNVDSGKCKMNNVFTDWHVAYHGTNRETAKLIFKSGLNLLKPGDYTIDGNKIGINDGHIRQCIWRRNHYTNGNELFDPNQIFVSPSIIYAANEIYAKPFYCFNNTLKVQCAFQLRIRPNSYGIGQETVDATKQGYIIDANFSNHELEWYTKENVGIVVHGLLVKITRINNKNKNSHPMYIDLT